MREVRMVGNIGDIFGGNFILGSFILFLLILFIEFV